MSLLEALNLRDVIANRPVAGTGAGKGRIFYATDTLLAYRDNGSSWDPITTAAAAPTIAQIQQQALTAADDSGAADAYVVTLSPAPTIAKYSLAVLKVAHTNTGASTLAVTGAVSGGAATPVKKGDGATALVAGDWTAGQIVLVMHDGTNWQWIGAGSGGGAASPYTAPPAIGTFTWMNQAGGVAASASQATGPYPNVISINIPDAALNWKMLTRPVPGGTPYRLIVCIRSVQFEKNSQNTGIYFSDGTKLMGLEFLSQGGSAQSFLRCEKMNSVTADNSTVAQWPSGSFALGGPPFGEFWLQLRNDGTKLYFDWSRDGCVFYNLFNENIGVFLTPTVYGVGGVSVCSSASYFVQVSLLSWQELNT